MSHLFLTYPGVECASPERDTISYFTFLVGTQDLNSRYKTQHIFQSCPNLIRNSKILSKYHSSVSSPRRSDHDTIYHLPNVDPQAFHLELQCQSTRPGIWLCANLEKKGSWTDCWPIVNAHILATTIEHAKIADFIIDVLAEKQDPKQCADKATIKHIFSVKGASSKLKEHWCIAV